MTDQICPLCDNAIELGEPFFSVPRLPEGYGFDDLVGATHRSCLLAYERRDGLRRALAQSIAGAIHSPPTRWIAAVDGPILRVDATEPMEYTVWNLADFVKFTIVDAAIEAVREIGPGDEVSISGKLKQELKVRPGGMVELVTPMGSTPMPTLPLQRLQNLFSDTGRFDLADVVVRLKAVEGPMPIGSSIVGWGRGEPSSMPVEHIPVLLQAVDRLDDWQALTYLMTFIDPVDTTSRLRPGDSISLGVNNEIELEVVAIELPPGPPLDTEPLFDREPSNNQAVRATR